MVMISAHEPWLTRTKARFELLLQSGRDPESASTTDAFASRMTELARATVTEWHPPTAVADPALIDEQASATLAFLNGVMMNFVGGTPVVRNVEHLDYLIQAMLAGIRRRLGSQS